MGTSAATAAAGTPTTWVHCGDEGHGELSGIAAGHLARLFDPASVCASPLLPAPGPVGAPAGVVTARHAVSMQRLLAVVMECSAVDVTVRAMPATWVERTESVGDDVLATGRAELLQVPAGVGALAGVAPLAARMARARPLPALALVPPVTARVLAAAPGVGPTRVVRPLARVPALGPPRERTAHLPVPGPGPARAGGPAAGVPIAPALPPMRWAPTLTVPPPESPGLAPVPAVAAGIRRRCHAAVARRPGRGRRQRGLEPRGDLGVPAAALAIRVLAAGAGHQITGTCTCAGAGPASSSGHRGG